MMLFTARVSTTEEPNAGKLHVRICMAALGNWGSYHDCPSRNREMWKSLVEGLGKECRFEPQASNSEIAGAESKLNVELPDFLKACLLESNGVFGEYDLGLVWPVEHII